MNKREKQERIRTLLAVDRVCTDAQEGKLTPTQRRVLLTTLGVSPMDVYGSAIKREDTQ